MKDRHNEGFSLVEVLVSISVLALIVIPVCSGLILSFRMNAKTNELMQAQLAVSSAVETLMAEGIKKGTTDTEKYDGIGKDDRFPDVTVNVETVEGKDYYKVTVATNDNEVSVTTYIHTAEQEKSTENTPEESTEATEQTQPTDATDPEGEVGNE